MSNGQGQGFVGFAAVAFAVGLLMLFAAGSAQAAYTTGTPLSISGTVGDASGVAINQTGAGGVEAGTVYVGEWGQPTLTENGKVFRFSPAGTDLGCTLAPPVPNPGAVAINPENGDLYAVNVAIAQANSRLRTFPAACGSEKGTEFQVEANRERAIPQPATDASGNLYWPNPFGTATGGKVEKITPAGTKTLLIEGLNRPTATALDSTGNLFVVTGSTTSSNCPNGKLVKFNLSGTLPKTLADGSTFVEGNVSTVAVDRSTNNVFVGRGCGVSFHVERYSAGGAKLNDFGTGLFVNTGSNGIYNQLAVNESNGRVYATDAGHKQVQVFNSVVLPKLALKVEKTGAGEGTVVSDRGEPTAINCGPACDEETQNFEESSYVTLTATAAAGSSFVEWESCDETGAGAGFDPNECRVSMSTAKTVKAKFDTNGFSLTITKDGTGTGEAECKVNGGSLEPCAGPYVSGTSIELVATASAGSEFAGFSNGTGSASACTTSPCGPFTIEANSSVTATFNAIPRTLTITKDGTGTGEVLCKVNGGSAGACLASYPNGTPLELVATPDSGSEFVNFNNGTGSASSCSATPCAFTIVANSSVTATFNLQQHALTITKDGAGTGEVKCEINGGSLENCASTYADGTSVKLVATANAGSEFAGFSNGTGSATACTTSPCTFTIKAPSSVTATFPLEGEKTLIISEDGTGTGEVECKVNGGSAGACLASYPSGTQLELVATPDAGSEFVNFNNGTGSASACSTSPCAFTIAANSSVTATFNSIQRTLTINKAGTGNGTFECDTGSGFGACAASYPDGTDITIKAVPDSHSTFAGWSGGGCSGTGNCVINDISSNTTVTGTFTLAQRTLTINKAGTGNGSFECDTGSGFGACAASYPDGTDVTIKAVPNAGSTFAGWSGGGCSGTGNCVINDIAANTTVTGTFNLNQSTLTINKAGTGNGTFECDTGSGFGACQSAYANGTTITIKALPDSNSTFAGWSGGGCSGTGNCVISSISSNTTVTGTFTPIQRTLTIDKAGSGDGSFTCDSGAGFGPCQASYPSGKNIVIHAIPDSHSTFASWAGCNSQPSTGNCGMTNIGTDTTVTVTFTLKPHSLAVNKAGSGSGSVSCDGGPCASSYPEGTVVTLKATADSGSTFGGWSGAGCSGTGDCTVTIDGDKTVTATFDKSAAGGGGGSGGGSGDLPPGVAVTPPSVPVQGNNALVALSCKGAGACTGVLKLFAKLPVNGGKKKNVMIGKTSFDLASGAEKTVKVKITNPQAKQLLNKGKKLRATVKGSGVKPRTVDLRKSGGKKPKRNNRRADR
jgi:hypothetical protein